MRIHPGVRTAVAVVAIAGAAACSRGSGETGGAAQREQQARADSARGEEKSLRDSGVTVDTQVVDTGGAAPQSAEDN